jgi:predicted Na+-dependent transporter
MNGVETLYAALLVLALVLNGITVAARVPLASLLAPVREGGLMARVLLIDLALVPLVVVGTATLLDVDDVTRAALVIVSAASCGPVSIALARIGRGDVPLSVTLVIGLGALNLVTVPIVTTLLLPTSIAIPLDALLPTLLGLAVAPLLIGRGFGIAAGRIGVSPERLALTLDGTRRIGDIALAGAVTTALLLEPRMVVEALAGHVTVVAIITMMVVTLAARLATADGARVRTIAIAINARAVGLALTLATLHLGSVPGLRATVLAYGGVTQILPILVVLALRRLPGSTVDPVGTSR